MCIFCVASDRQAGGQVETAAFSGTPSAIEPLIWGISWSGAAGQAAAVTYGFSASYYGGLSMSSTQRTAAVAVMQEWENVANIDFSESSFFPDIALTQLSLGGNTLGLTYNEYLGAQLSRSEVQIDTGETGFTAGGSGYLTLLHEIGHAIGLKHPGNYNGDDDPPFLSASVDSTDYTVMSYLDGTYSGPGNQASGPMILDIQAAQFLYGANTSYNAGSTAYAYSGATLVKTLWDGGGAADSVSVSGYSGAVTIDLREGESYITRIGATTLWNAIGANIENANGGEGADTLYGNTLANTLSSAAGADTVYGHQGADALYGNLGNDALYGGQDADALYGGQDQDALYGNLADDTLFGNLGNDTLYGGQGNDAFYGGQGGDALYGNLGNDRLEGNLGNDTLEGGAGADVFYFAGDFGADTIADFSAGDVIQILTASGVQSLAYDTSSPVPSGSTLLDLGSGNTVTLLGVTVDSDGVFG